MRALTTVMHTVLLQHYSWFLGRFYGTAERELNEFAAYYRCVRGAF